MTVSVAIEILEVNAVCSPKATKFKEAVELAKQVLEKQIPQKPIEKFPFDMCPVCDTVVLEHMKHCTQCGQKLDWSDKE